MKIKISLIAICCLLFLGSDIRAEQIKPQIKPRPVPSKHIIKVLSPNGGEYWERGRQYSIQWQAGRVLDRVKIKLKWGTSHGGWFMVAESTPNDGLHEYTVPANIAYSGNRFLIYVMSLDESIQDHSDSGFTIGPGRPDLKISSVKTNPFGPDDTRFVSFKVNVKNQGKTDAIIGKGYWAVRNTVPWNPKIHYTGFKAQENILIGPEDIEKIQVNIGRIPAGAYEIVFTVDPEDVVDESDEQNNTRRLLMTVREAEKPDLLITSIWLDPPDAKASSDFRIVVRIKNQGRAPAVFRRAAIRKVIVRCAGMVYCLPLGLTLGPGEMHDCRIVPERIEAGSFNWTFRVDPDDHVVESDEGNNSRSIQFTIKED
jgi:hypothetical protein